MNLREIWNKGEYILNEAGIDNPKGDAFTLMEYVFHIDKNTYILRADDDLLPDEVSEYKTLLKKRASHIPLQYITGNQNFLGLDFKVNSSVLIPRLDTEVMVDMVRKELRDDMRVLDLCTGSGCIITCLKNYCPGINAVASDYSKAALLVAKENARQNHADVEFIHSDLFDKIKGEFDIIVSNPPYIPPAVILTLDPEVREYEPMEALDGGQDGLDFYRRIAGEAGKFLKDKGQLFLEIGHDQGSDVSDLLRQNGFSNISVIKDLANMDRIVRAIYSGES